MTCFGVSALGSLKTGVTEPEAEGKLRRQKLKGEALRDELMRREREEKKAILEANTAYYRARAYKVRGQRAPGGVGYVRRLGRP